MGYKVAVVGATGNVGREMLNILAEREFPVDEVLRARLAPFDGQRGLASATRRSSASDLETVRFPRHRFLPDVGGLGGLEGMVAQDRRPGLPGHRQLVVLALRRRTCRWSCRK